MGNLILCRSVEAEQPYYVEKLGVRLYTGEELSYFIYNNPMLIEPDMLDERLFAFIEEGIKMPALAEKLRRWKPEADYRELLLIILQDIHYYSSQELQQFQAELTRLAKAGPDELMVEKADYMAGIGRYYDAVRLYDRLLSGKADPALGEAFYGRVSYNKGIVNAKLFLYRAAMDSFARAYELMPGENVLKSMYEVHLMDESVEMPSQLLEEVSEETLTAWKAEFDTMKDQARYHGKALEVSAMADRDAIRRAAGYRDMLHQWVRDYRRCQS